MPRSKPVTRKPASRGSKIRPGGPRSALHQARLLRFPVDRSRRGRRRRVGPDEVPSTAAGNTAGTPPVRPTPRRSMPAPASSGSTSGPPSSISPRRSSGPRTATPGAASSAWSSSSSSTRSSSPAVVKAFLLFFDSCGICLECAGDRTACKEPKLARPTADALAVDVFSTVREAGLSDRGPVRLRPGDEPLRLPAHRLRTKEPEHVVGRQDPRTFRCRLEQKPG